MTNLLAFLFWYFVVLTSLRFFTMACGKYPRTLTIGIGTDVASVMVCIAITVWIGLIHFGIIQ